MLIINFLIPKLITTFFLLKNLINNMIRTQKGFLYEKKNLGNKNNNQQWLETCFINMKKKKNIRILRSIRRVYNHNGPNDHNHFSDRKGRTVEEAQSDCLSELVVLLFVSNKLVLCGTATDT